jgi:hypothetical protein
VLGEIPKKSLHDVDTAGSIERSEKADPGPDSRDTRAGGLPAVEGAENKKTPGAVMVEEVSSELACGEQADLTS